MGRVYDIREWRRVRRAQLTREPLCRRCLARGLEVLAVHVDHVTPIKKGGAWFDADNLQSLCVECHTRKTREDEGKQPGAPRLGCDTRGVPRDPQHPWNTGGK